MRPAAPRPEVVLHSHEMNDENFCVPIVWSVGVMCVWYAWFRGGGDGRGEGGVARGGKKGGADRVLFSVD
jgi:hypothetical protein